MSHIESDVQGSCEVSAATVAKGIRQSLITAATGIGHSAPLGSTVWESGVNFSVFSRNATSVELLLFDRDDDARPQRVIRIDPATNRNYHYWHVFVSGLQPGQIYGYRVHGPFDATKGLRFDPSKVLLDPYGRGVVVPKNYDRDAASKVGDNTATAMKSVVVDPLLYDWEGDNPLKRPSSQWNSSRYSSSIPWIALRAVLITGVMHRSHSSRRTRHTALDEMRWDL